MQQMLYSMWIYWLHPSCSRWKRQTGMLSQDAWGANKISWNLSKDWCYACKNCLFWSDNSPWQHSWIQYKPFNSSFSLQNLQDIAFFPWITKVIWLDYVCRGQSIHAHHSHIQDKKGCQFFWNYWLTSSWVAFNEQGLIVVTIVHKHSRTAEIAII